MKTDKLLIIDLELACWKNKPPGEIIQIGLCLIDFSDRSMRHNAFYVRPKTDEISEFCTQLTGITAEMLTRLGHPLDEVLKSIQKYYPLKSVPVGAWGNDFQLIIDSCTDKDALGPDRLNLAIVHALIHKLPKSVGLDEALEMAQMKFFGTKHNAEDDAYNLGKLMLKLCGSQEIKIDV
jgi:inhibitor of KinA sporulation pathway (predicted exonuclease)